MKKGKGVAIVLCILICLGLLGYYTTNIISDTIASQKETDNKKDGRLSDWFCRSCAGQYNGWN